MEMIASLLIKLSRKNSGFTLIELILASALTLVVITVAGFGIVVMTRENLASSASGDLQYNTNRALDFMAEEARSASSIRTSLLSLPSGFTVSGTYTPILGLNVSGQTNPIIYYIKQNTSDAWIGDQVIYRWGPPLSDTGGYTTGTWQHEALVDLVATTPQNTGCGSGISVGSGTTQWTKIPSSSPKGFFACVKNDGKMAEIHVSVSAIGYMGGVGVSTGSRYEDKATYEAVTQIYARSSAGVVGSGSTNLTIAEPAKATLTVSSGDCSNAVIKTGTTTIGTWTNTSSSFTTSTIYPSSSPVLSVEKPAGTALTFSATTAGDNQVQFSSAGCTINVALNTP